MGPGIQTFNDDDSDDVVDDNVLLLLMMILGVGIVVVSRSSLFSHKFFDGFG